MAENPDEVYERILAEEQAKGSSPAVAQARAKAGRMRAQKGLPTDPAGAAKAASAEGAATGATAEPQEQPAAEAPQEQPAAEVPQEQPAAEAAPEEPAAQAPQERPAAEAPQEQAAASGNGAQGDGAGDGAAARPAATVGAARPAAAAASEGAAPRGRGAAARAARAASGELSPERMQRLLAVVKPEAIQRVEKEPIDRVNTWPHLMAAEFLALLVITILLVVFSAFVDAPLRELANINQTPNPSKAPWYFLGLQELLRYFHPSVAGVSIPQWIILGFFAAPYIDRNPSTKPDDRKLAIVLFTIFLLFNAILVIAGSLFRGPGFNWIYPWEIPVGTIFEL